MIIVRLKEALCAYAERTGDQLTYGELATRAGLSRATIEALGSRPTYNTTLATIDKLCQVLGCNVSDLLLHEPNEE